MPGIELHKPSKYRTPEIWIYLKSRLFNVWILNGLITRLLSLFKIISFFYLK